MRLREASVFVAYSWRWKVALAAILVPVPLLIAFFRSSSLEGWRVSNGLFFSGSLAIWIGLVLSLISPVRHWRVFKAVLIAISCLLLGCLALGIYAVGTDDAPTPFALVMLGCVSALVVVAAMRVRAPSPEETRIARIADASYGQPVAWCIKLLAVIMWLVLVSFMLIPLYEMLS